MADEFSLATLLMTGEIEPHKWKCFGKEVVYDLFPMGTVERIESTVSGLDVQARRVHKDIYDLAHALRSIAGYDFKASVDEKLKSVRAMSPPLFRVFVEELRSAELKAADKFDKAFNDLKA